MNDIIKYHTKKDGSIKYYASYQSAWVAAARLNGEQSDDAQWLFEMDTTGWFVFLVPFEK